MRIIRQISQLIRLPNLFIIALVMYMMRLMLVEPLIIMSHQAPYLSSLKFFLLVLSTLLIAAGGYIINDIEDIQIDKFNNRENIFNKGMISKDAGYNLYLALSFCGICIGFYLTLIAGIKYIAYINLVSAGLLYFYSTTYKRQFLIGNIIISLLTALSMAIVYLTEKAAPLIDPLKILCSGYVLFAFLLSMAREIIKDMEDVKGDQAAGCRTLAVVAGNRTSKTIAGLLLLFILVLLIAIQLINHQWEAIISFLYVAILIEIPLVLLIVSLIIATSPADFRRCSLLAKIIMLTGILSMPVFFYSF